METGMYLYVVVQYSTVQYILRLTNAETLSSPWR